MEPNRRGPSSEYLLQGSVLDDSVDILLHRLRGMCDDSEDGLVRFKDHEIIYSMREATNAGTVSVRVRKQLNNPEQPWTLCYLGNPEELGFTVDYEYISQGWLFKKNRLKTTVAKICRTINGQMNAELAPISRSHLVEVSTISSSSNEQAATEIHAFSEQLKPLVSLDKIDPRRLGI